MKSKKVNLAKAILNNHKCLGYCWQVKKGGYQYQNDNDLGLDMDALDCVSRYTKKVYVGDGYFFYVMYGLWEDNINIEPYHVSLKMVGTLLKECHPHLFQLTEKEKRLTQKFWAQF